MPSFRFIILGKDGREDRKFERPLFPADVKQNLMEFCECATVLNECSFVKNWSRVKLTMHYANDGQITDTGILPPDDEISAFLHRLRPFYLSKERYNFDKVTNLVSRHLADPAITELIRLAKRYYDGRSSRDLFQISVNGKPLNSNEFFDNYVNALEYHRDKARRQNIDAIAKHFPLEAQKQIFVLLLSMRLNAINKFTSFLLTCLDREDGRPLTIRTL